MNGKEVRYIHFLSLFDFADRLFKALPILNSNWRRKEYQI